MNLISSPSQEVSIFDESGEIFPCAATIISSYFILTFASCLYGKTENKWTITKKIQNSKWADEEEKIKRNISISRVIFHPNFKNTSSENDLALLVLHENLNSISMEKIPVELRNKRESTAADLDFDTAYDALVNFPDFSKVTKTVEREIDDYQQTVVNGLTVNQTIDPIPYQLSIKFQEFPPYSQWVHICGGVILDETTAITAAHCFVKSRNVDQYRVVAGENLLHVTENKEQVLPVRKIIIHPDYTSYNNGSDIAILYVDRIRFNKYARGVWLSPFHNKKHTDKVAVISGWGAVSNQAVPSNSLQKGNVSIMSAEDCQQHVEKKWRFLVKKGILCAFNPVTRTCTGDSGGPLVIQNYKLGNSVGNLLVGIVSFGATDCERPNTVGGFTEITHFYGWIQQNRAKKPCEVKTAPCVSGGCYNVDLKCDKEEDCPDGTDEINCNEKPTIDLESITSCGVAMETLPSPRSPKQWIYPHGNSKKVEVVCDFDVDGGGWTIIQKRSSGPKFEFDQNWSEYVNGFGSLDQNFWLGLENIRALTKNGDQELRIQLEDFEGNKAYAQYSNFSISDASDFYRLSISGYSGDSTAGDSMTNSNLHFSDDMLDGAKFGTKDQHNDNWDFKNCAVDRGGWWFKRCSLSYLNGIYREKDEKFHIWEGVHWATWKGWEISLSKTKMMIRKKK